MKKLLVIALSLVSAAVLAADKPQAKTHASPKADAKDGAKAGTNKVAKAAAPKAKAPAKAAAKPAAKKPGFQAYAAGEWKPIDKRKGLVYGYRLTDGDLVHQPVLVVKFDPDVEIDNDKRETDPRFIYQFLGWEVKVQPHLQVVNVPSRPLTKEELLKVGKKAGSTAAIPGFPWYEDVGLVQEPENAGGAYPFYYVVSTDGQVIYAGNRGSDAKAYVYGSLKKSGEPDPMLGFVKPQIHADLCSGLKFGTDTTKVVAKLKPLAAKGTEESMAEAKAILEALDQTKTYMLKTVLAKLNSDPQEAILIAQQSMKTFPRDKQMFQDAAARLLNNPAVKQSLKTFQTLAEVHQRMADAEAGKGTPLKKADVKKAYQEALKGERMCAKARKEFGDKLPRAFMTLEDIVQVVKAELEAAGASAK